MAPDQRITMLVTICRYAVEQAVQDAKSERRAERMFGKGVTPDWQSFLPDWHARMVAVLKQFEDIK